MRHHWLINDDRSPGKAKRMNITQEGEEQRKLEEWKRMTEEDKENMIRKAIKTFEEKTLEYFNGKEEINKRNNGPSRPKNR